MAARGLAGQDELADGAGRRSTHPLALAWFLLIALLLLGAAAIAIFGKASDGEPSAKFDLAPPHRVAQAKPQPHATASNTNLIGAGPQPTAPMPPAPSPTAAPLSVVPANITKAIYAGSALIADPDLIEQTPNGPLPRIADNGRSPMTAYAPPSPNMQGPKIAIVVSGLGISAKATAAAIDNLPAGVTLAFAPYADDVQRWVIEARKRGHEVLLEIPMEPYDFPDSDPGPHTLRAGTTDDSNIDRLTWSLTRFTGYAGVTNLLGGRFMADGASLEPIMTFVARRGLVFFDSGSATRSAAPDVAQRTSAPFVQSATNIDAIQTGMEIDQRLSELESRARLNGYAAGSAFLYPITVERLAAWAQSLSGRGFVLVPASAIVQPSK
ncbi:MAG TPA: divergent polysaccharide deacetylase family protein [Rhizomicrobium sp.]